MDRTVAYNSRCDDNPVNAISWVSFLSVGSTRQLDAIANALEAKPNWETDIGNSLSYLMFADRLSFFWHRQFRFVFADHPQPLRMMDWESMTLTMGLAFAIGWRELAEFQGCLTTATLNRAYHLANGQDERHRRGHAFMCRLFASWRRDGTGHRFPGWAHGVPAYEQLLDRWRSADTPELERLLLSACDHHLEQGTLDTKNACFDFGDDRIARVPLEIFMLLRLREFEGLAVPRLTHPLMEAPFDELPSTIPVPAPDEYMRGTMMRVSADWPQFADQTSLDAIKTFARQS